MRTYSENETFEWAVSFGKNLKKGTVIALEGNLGAGKTVICRGICAGLGFNGRVCSPSYALVHEYPNTPPIFHLDLYRLKSESDLTDIGLENFILSDGVTLIEWARGTLPLTHKLTIDQTGEQERKISVEHFGKKRVYISLGSNIEPREEFLAKARNMLKQAEPSDWLESTVHETEPWGVEEQPDFLNQVVSFVSEKNPFELLKLCKDIEQKLGRQPRGRWQEREIDLDLLYCGDSIVETDELIVPHPRINERDFVLKLLGEILSEPRYPRFTD